MHKQSVTVLEHLNVYRPTQNMTVLEYLNL